jgi:CRISPR system Cascade subunit CasA
VQNIRFAAGIALAEDPNATDSMACYRMGSDKMVRVTFTEGRALWRDFSAMVPDASGMAAMPAAVLSWATNLYNALGQFDMTLTLVVAGVASGDKPAKIARWRIASLCLPVSLASDMSLAQFLRQHIQHAEDVYGHIRKVASELLAKMSPDPGSKDTYTRARAMVEAGPLASSYYASLELALPALMAQLAGGDEQVAHEQWSQAIRYAADQAWQALVRTTGQSIAALRAQAITYPKFKAILKQEVLA